MAKLNDTKKKNLVSRNKEQSPSSHEHDARVCYNNASRGVKPKRLATKGTNVSTGTCTLLDW